MSNLEQLHPRCDLSITSIGWAAQRVGPSFTYELWIHPDRVVEVVNFLRHHGMMHERNPLSPYVNVQPTDGLEITEWYLVANEKCVGSRGIT